MFYINLLTSGKLNSYLADINVQAEELFFRLVKQLAEKEGITKELKHTNQMAWIDAMNNIQTREYVYTDIVYVYSYFGSGMRYSYRFFFHLRSRLFHKAVV